MARKLDASGKKGWFYFFLLFVVFPIALAIWGANSGTQSDDYGPTWCDTDPMTGAVIGC